MNLPESDQEIAAFLAAFEACTLPKERWTHSAHILGGAWYVHQLGEDAALAHMRACIQRFNVAVGGENTETGGYHETVTVFWIKLLHAFLRDNPALERAAFARAAVSHFASQRQIYKQYYDFEVVASVEARARWVAPNRKAL